MRAPGPPMARWVAPGKGPFPGLFSEQRVQLQGVATLPYARSRFPLTRWAAHDKEPFAGLVAGRQDCLATIGNLREGNP
jgi:hypothetical protein